MPTKPTREAAHTGVGDRYLDLIREFPLRPIRSDEQLARASAMIDSLVDRDDLDPEEEDYLDVLSDLVERYEDEAHPLPPISGADMLRHLLETRDTTQAGVSAGTGIAESTLSEILAGRRGLNVRHIGALAKFFHVSPAVFIPE